MSYQKELQLSKFLDDFKNDITNIYGGLKQQREVSYSVPSTVSKICFINRDSGSSGVNSRLFENVNDMDLGENVFVYSTDKSVLKTREWNNVDIAKTTELENPFCIGIKDGKINALISKSTGQKYVTVSGD